MKTLFSSLICFAFCGPRIFLKKYPTAIIIGILAVSVFFLPKMHANAQEYFRIASLGSLQFDSLPGTFRDYRLNDSGQVTGFMKIGTQSQGVIWQNGSITYLGYYPGATTAAAFSYGIGINNSGTIAGQVNDRFGGIYAAIHNASGWQSLLYPPNYNYTLPTAISSSGQVVGYTTVTAYAAPYGQGFYSANANGNTYPILLTPLNGDGYGIAYGINNANQIVGDSINTSGANPVHTAVLWSTNGTLVGNFASGGSSAQCLNSSYAVGYIGSNAVIFGLGVITNGVANSINVNNFVVGNTVQTATASQSRAWFYSQNQGVFNINLHQSSGLILYTASDINSRLQFVGQSSTGGYMATPVAIITNSGNWSSSSIWQWGLIPSNVNPVTISATSTNVLIVTGAESPTIVAELNIGLGSNAQTAAFILYQGETLGVVGNMWGNGVTTISPSGVVFVDGTLNSQVIDQGILVGSGIINGNLSLQMSGIVQPGDGGPGILTITGNATFNSNASVNFEIEGTTIGSQCSQMVFGGILNIANAALDVFTTNYIPSIGQTFTLLHSSNTNTIVGNFDGLPEGGLLTNFLNSGLSATISYMGGSGDDVVLTVIATSQPMLGKTKILPSGAIQLNGVGTANIEYSVQANTNLSSTNWISIGSTTADNNGVFQYIDTLATNYAERFYRIAYP